MEGNDARRLLSVLALTLLVLVPFQADSGKASAKGAEARAANCIFDHTMLRTTPGTCRPTALTYPGTVTGKVRRAIYDSALTFGVPYTLLLHTARCESGLNPKARNGAHYGLFQFAPDTFRRAKQFMHQQTGIVAKTYWSPGDSSYVAGFMFAVGQATSWSCL